MPVNDFFKAVAEPISAQYFISNRNQIGIANQMARLYMKFSNGPKMGYNLSITTDISKISQITNYSTQRAIQLSNVPILQFHENRN